MAPPEIGAVAVNFVPVPVVPVNDAVTPVQLVPPAATVAETTVVFETYRIAPLRYDNPVGGEEVAPLMEGVIVSPGA